MKKFCIITNSDKDENYELAKHIKNYLDDKNMSCEIMENKLNEEFGERHFTNSQLIPKGTECALVLGGDGTMIQAAIDLIDLNLPMLGINIGTVGFLTEVDKNGINVALEKLMNDDFTIEKRIMLKGTTQHSILSAERHHFGEEYALNDIIVCKKKHRLITMQVLVNDELVDTYCADGLIIATPTGSTGYNLSAGGPVIAPHSRTIVITPICPHSLNKRSVVVDARDVISVVIGKTKENQTDFGTIVADGKNTDNVVTGDRVIIEVSEYETKLVKLSGIGFYEKMRLKFNGTVTE